MNKKALLLALKFMMGLILAIAMLALFTNCTSKFLRLTDQSKDSFGTFVGHLKNLQASQPETKKTELLLLDHGTAAVYFEENKVNTKAKIASEDGDQLKEYDVIISKPSKCKITENCLCLFREPEFEYDLAVVPKILRIKDDGAACQAFTMKLQLQNCGLGNPKGIAAQTCTSGFFIEHNLIKDSETVIIYYEKSLNRQALQLERKGDSILISG